MKPNSPTVMACRNEPLSSLDDFPTPPWATRALIEHVFRQCGIPILSGKVWEPAAGRGHMVRTLKEYFPDVTGSDIHDYGSGYQVMDFVKSMTRMPCRHIITNPPFKLAERFALRANEIATRTVCLLLRASWLESKGRYERLFKHMPPAYVAPFVERVTIVKSRLQPKGSGATAYAWFVWDKDKAVRRPEIVFIPPCRDKLERPSDYE